MNKMLLPLATIVLLAACERSPMSPVTNTPFIDRPGFSREAEPEDTLRGEYEPGDDHDKVRQPEPGDDHGGKGENEVNNNRFAPTVLAREIETGDDRGTKVKNEPTDDRIKKQREAQPGDDRGRKGKEPGDDRGQH